MLSQKQISYRKQLLARIHTHPVYKQAKANEAWGDMLEANFETSSSAELSIKELNLLLDLLNGRDFNPTKPDYKGRAIIKENSASNKQLIKLYALFDELGYVGFKRTEFIYRQLNRFVPNPDLLSKSQITNCIIGLEAIKNHRHKTKK